MSYAQKSYKLGDTIEGRYHILTMAETIDRVWIGTENGIYLVKKKSGKVSHITSKNSDIFPGKINAICATTNDRVWIATNYGLICYDGFAFFTLTTDNCNLPENTIVSLYTDDAGNLVAETQRFGKYILKKGYHFVPVRTQVMQGITCK
jgi:ligand-binding sensor domain-containing protein